MLVSRQRRFAGRFYCGGEREPLALHEGRPRERLLLGSGADSAHLGIAGVTGVRVGRRVELAVTAADADAARAVVARLAGELLSNPLMEQYEVEALGESPAPAGAGVAG